MIGLCLVLLVGGSPAGAPRWSPQGPVEPRLHRAVVLPAEALEPQVRAEDAPAPEDAPVPEPDAGPVPPLRKAAVIRAPDPTKEH